MEKRYILIKISGVPVYNIAGKVLLFESEEKARIGEEVIKEFTGEKTVAVACVSLIEPTIE